MYKVFGYRKSIVWGNISRSFPNKSELEQKEIMTSFYHHFFDILVESLKGFTISEKEVQKRFKVKNPELVNEQFEKGKDILMVGGHYNNWEMFAYGIGLKVKHQPIAIYRPLKNKFFDRKMKDSRQKYGLVMCGMKETRKYFNKDFGKPTAVVFGIDQTPSNVYKCHWMTFLNQETPVFFGAERYSKEYNRPIMFGTLRKLKRGHYEVEFQLVTEDPASLAKGQITELNTRMLEADIIENPEYWLWTHNRWKRKKPADYEEKMAAAMKSSNPESITQPLTTHP